MKILKNNIKLMIGIIIGALCSAITVYASTQYLANEVSYTPSDENWKVTNVEAALNELYDREKHSNPLLVGSGSTRYSSSVTTPTIITAHKLKEEGIPYLQLENNVFTVKKEGNYIIVLAVGSDMQSMSATSYSGWAGIEINNEEVLGAGQSYDMYACHSKILNLKVGDTIVGKYKADGGNYMKRAQYDIFYVG